MSRACEIVRYRPEHKDGVAELQTVLWSPDPAANRRYFEWKYEANPWSTQPRVYLALRDGRLAGMRGFYESRWEVGTPTQIASIPVADDFAIEIEQRNGGVATQIMQTAIAELADSGFDYVFSLSAGPVTVMGSLALGWKSAGRVDPLVRREPGSGSHARLRERMRRAPVLWRWVNASILHSAPERAPFRALDAGRSDGRVVIAREARPDAMAELVAGLGHDGRLRHVRSREYLAWRFANPMHDYRFLYATRGDQIVGYLVLRARAMSLTPTPRVCIADLVGDDARIRADLLTTAIEAGRFAELVAWAATLAPNERVLLRDLGFAPLDPAWNARGWPCVLVRATREKPSGEWSLGARPLLDPATWDLRMVDSMAG
jgi:acetyltransferase (GNAT) family protein